MMYIGFNVMSPYSYKTMSLLELKVDKLNHQSETPHLTEEKIHVTTCVTG